MLLGHLNQTFSLLLAADCLTVGPNRRVGGSFSSMKVTYREHLDAMLRAQCGNNPDMHLEMTPKAHGHAKHGVLVHYYNGHLHIICGKCKDRVAIIAVASEPKSTALAE